MTTPLFGVLLEAPHSFGLFQAPPTFLGSFIGTGRCLPLFQVLFMPQASTLFRFFFDRSRHPRSQGQPTHYSDGHLAYIKMTAPHTNPRFLGLPLGQPRVKASQGAKELGFPQHFRVSIEFQGGSRVTVGLWFTTKFSLHYCDVMVQWR